MRHPAAAASAVLLLLAGCSKKSSDDDGPPPITVTIGTTPAPADILVGGSVTFTASAAYGTAPYTYLWTFPGGTPASSTEQNPGTVAFNAAGANLVTLQVTDTTGRPGSSSVIVNVYKILQSISLTPATADLKQAATLDFTVTATFTDASTLDVTASSLITSGDTTRIRMTDNRALGLVGPTLATVTITAGYTHGVAGNSGTDNSAVTLLDPDVLWTKAQIQAQWNSFKAVETLASYNTGHVPNMRVDGIPGDEGELKPQMITDGINRANMYRYLAGLPYAVSQDAGNTVRCQKGAHVLTMLRLQGLTVANPHSPPLPVGATLNYQTFIYTDGAAACGESNIMMGWFSGTDAAYVPLLTECVDGWMDDGGVSTLGHRRWILHPELQTTALGMVWAYRSLDGRTYFSALMHVSDTDNPTPPYDFVAYPSGGFYPKQLFDDPSDGARVLWSFSADNATYGFDAQTAVTVVRQSDNATLPVTTTILPNGYGISPTISFNPNESTLGETYYVTVSNINVLAGGHTSYSYWVSFYNLTP